MNGDEMFVSVENWDFRMTVKIGQHRKKQLSLGGFCRLLNQQSNDDKDKSDKGCRQDIFAEVGNIDTPPDPMPVKDYAEYNAKRIKKNAFWFVQYTTKGRSAAVKSGGWKYCYYINDCEELYNLDKDPLELKNLANDSKHSARKEQLKCKLIENLLCAPHAEHLKEFADDKKFD